MKKNQFTNRLKFASLFATILIVSINCSDDAGTDIGKKESSEVKELAARTFKTASADEINMDLQRYQSLSDEELSLFFQHLNEQQLEALTRENPKNAEQHKQEAERLAAYRSKLLALSKELFNAPFNKLNREQMDKLFAAAGESSNNSAREAACTIRVYDQGATTASWGAVTWNAWNMVTPQGQSDCDYEFRFPAESNPNILQVCYPTNWGTQLILTMGTLGRRQANGNTYILIGNGRLNAFLAGNPSWLGMQIQPRWI